MPSKDLEHHRTQGALAGALFAAHEDDNYARWLFWILNGPGEPLNKIFELGFVAPANDLPDMPQEAP